MVAYSCDDIAMSLTMRHCFAALKAIKRGFPIKKAVIKTIVKRGVLSGCITTGSFKKILI